MSTTIDPEKYLAGIVMPDRVERFAPHRCRCQRVVDGVPVDWCMQMVHEGPDEPFCRECREKHWGPTAYHDPYDTYETVAGA
jgi:hypothetical protein